MAEKKEIEKDLIEKKKKSASTKKVSAEAAAGKTATENSMVMRYTDASLFLLP